MSFFTVSSEALESRIKQSNFYRFVTAYRQHGHKKANINPIAITDERFVDVYKYYYIIMKLSSSAYSQSGVTHTKTDFIMTS
jgi:2-oxoglutarate dehydrogenase complex dehydrogenase (E1) component-like enzyme